MKDVRKDVRSASRSEETLNNFSIYAGKELDVWRNKINEPLNADEAKFLHKWLPQDHGMRILEGGTGSGRISFNLSDRGYSNIVAFDFVPEMIAAANAVASERPSPISFFVGDATTASDWLPYEKNSFDYVLYMQQLLSLIPLEDWPQTLGCVHALLKPNGYFLATFLYDEGRRRNKILRPTMRVIRSCRGQKEHPYRLPWLKLGERPNLRFWQRNQALVNWLPEEDILRRLKTSGLKIVDVTTSANLINKAGKRGFLFVVCQN